MIRRAGWMVAAALLLAACGTDSGPAARPSPARTASGTPSPSPSPSPSRTTMSPRPSPSPTRSPRPAPSKTRTRKPTPAATRTTQPPPPPPPPPPRTRRVYVLGDSVLLGARTTVPAALPGWRVTMDTVGSRRLPQGIEVLRAMRAQLTDTVVIQLGNNYLASEGSYAAQLDEAMRVLRGARRVVWLTVAEKWPSRAGINAAIRAAAARWPALRVADWARLVAGHPEYAGDMLHLTAAGRLAIARLIANHVRA